VISTAPSVLCVPQGVSNCPPQLGCHIKWRQVVCDLQCAPERYQASTQRLHQAHLQQATPKQGHASVSSGTSSAPGESTYNHKPQVCVKVLTTSCSNSWLVLT
jgi:hypothetical protein